MNLSHIDIISVGRAILRLRPDSEWSISDKNVNTLVWHTEGVDPITQQELDDMIEVIKAELLSEQ
jgi:hypothetical protein